MISYESRRDTYFKSGRGPSWLGEKNKSTVTTVIANYEPTSFDLTDQSVSAIKDRSNLNLTKTKINKHQTLYNTWALNKRMMWNKLDKRGDSRLAIKETMSLLPFDASITISSSHEPNESGANRTLNTALSPGAITDCPWGYCPF